MSFSSSEREGDSFGQSAKCTDSALLPGKNSHASSEVNTQIGASIRVSPEQRCSRVVCEARRRWALAASA